MHRERHKDGDSGAVAQRQKQKEWFRETEACREADRVREQDTLSHREHNLTGMSHEAKLSAVHLVTSH